MNGFNVVLCTYTVTCHSRRSVVRAVVSIRDVQKTKTWFAFSLKNQTVQKLDICSDGFPMETVCNRSTVQIKSDKTSLAFSVQIKNVIKHCRNSV